MQAASQCALSRCPCTLPPSCIICWPLVSVQTVPARALPSVYIRYCLPDVVPSAMLGATLLPLLPLPPPQSPSLQQPLTGRLILLIPLPYSMPAAVITSSGTAVANLLPAVVEASQSNIPLLLITADRPSEMRDSGANQTIDQVKIFGGYTRWAVDVPPPDPAVPVRALLTTTDAAVRFATGTPAGPVHINCQFREPLAPNVVEWPKSLLKVAALANCCSCSSLIACAVGLCHLLCCLQLAQVFAPTGKAAFHTHRFALL